MIQSCKILPERDVFCSLTVSLWIVLAKNSNEVESMIVLKGCQVFHFLPISSTFDHLINEAGTQNVLLVLLLSNNSGKF